MTIRKITIQTALSTELGMITEYKLTVPDQWFTKFFKFLLVDGELFGYDDIVPMSGSAGYIKMIDGKEVCRFIIRQA